MSVRDRLDPPLSIDQPKPLRIVPHGTTGRRVFSLFDGPARSNGTAHPGIEDMPTGISLLDIDGEGMMAERGIMIIRESERENSHDFQP